METYVLEKDLKIMYVNARSFPDGVPEAFKTLEKTIMDVNGRTFFGISKPNKRGIIEYRAGVLESFEGEAGQYGLKIFVLKKGEYLTETLKQWRDDPGTIIGASFTKLLETPRLDPASFCVEWYKDEDVMCMVKLK